MANEKRLIDANELVAKLEDLKSDLYGWEDYNTGVDSAVYKTENAPTVDAVEVVRCKDCKHFNHQKALRPGGIWCEYWGTDPDPDDFCSYGERRNDHVQKPV